MKPNHKNTLQKANEAVANGDIEGFLKYCSDDITWTFVGDQSVNGKEAVRAYMIKTYKEPPRFDVQQWIEDDDFLVAIGEIILKENNGASVRYKYCDVWKFRDGLMAELHAYVIKTGGEA